MRVRFAGALAAFNTAIEANLRLFRSLLDMIAAGSTGGLQHRQVEQVGQQSDPPFVKQVESRWPTIWLHRSQAKLQHGDFEAPHSSLLRACGSFR